MHCALNYGLRLPLLSILSTTLFVVPRVVDADSVTAIPESFRARYDLPDFYQKMTDAGGIPILASSQPADASLLEARFLIESMLKTAPALHKALADSGLRVTVMAANEFTTDVPEHRHLTPKNYWDRRARGLGGTPKNPVVSCGEENLLEYAGDPYKGENILIHEFSHSVHLVGMAILDPDFDARLRRAYDRAKENGLWEGTYAMSNHEEYFAEGSQSWFDCNAPPGAVHGEIRRREELRSYDPALNSLLQKVYGNNGWRYSTPSRRGDGNQSAGLQAAFDKRFAWPDSLKDATEQTDVD